MAGVVASVCPVTSPAQSVEGRHELQVLRDSLEFIHTAPPLRSLESAAIEAARADRDNPMLHLRLGFIAIRLHAIDAVSHADDAIAEFEWAAALEPDWPWPWFGLGLSELLVEDHSRSAVGGLWYMLGLDRERRSTAAFERAIAADPSFVEGVAAFARGALARRIDAPNRAALVAIRAATASPIGWHPDLLLERGRLERIEGHPDSAVTAFTRALLLGRKTEVAWVELAKTLSLIDTLAVAADAVVAQERAEAAYFVAAASTDPIVVAMYRRSIQPIVSDSQLKKFDALDPSARAAWLRQFWGRRDAVDLRSSGARLQEHHRRWDVATREFRLPPFRRRYEFGVELFRSADPELDDRGVIWLRHGAPAVRIEWPKSRSRNYGNESWRYDRPDGSLVLHFVAEQDAQDFRVVESPTSLEVPRDLIAGRAHELPGVARLMRINPESPSWGWVSEEVRLRGRQSMAIATRTDSWERQYSDRLTAQAQWFAVGERDGFPTLHLLYAIDASALRALPGADTLAMVPVTARAVALDDRGATVGALDITELVPMPLAGTRFAALHAVMGVKPGVIRVRLGVEASPAVGNVFPVTSLVAPVVTGGSLTMSALVVGEPTRSLPRVVSGADTAWFDANSTYLASDTVVIYAEGYGIRDTVPVTMRLTVSQGRSAVARWLGRPHATISLTERLTPGGNVIVFRRALGLGALKPGDYTVELRLEQNGRGATRQRTITIR